MKLKVSSVSGHQVSETLLKLQKSLCELHLRKRSQNSVFTTWFLQNGKTLFRVDFLWPIYGIEQQNGFHIYDAQVPHNFTFCSCNCFSWIISFCEKFRCFKYQSLEISARKRHLSLNYCMQRCMSMMHSYANYIHMAKGNSLVLFLYFLKVDKLEL